VIDLVLTCHKIGYSSLGTFEFLVHESKPEFYFLEVNPRLQVEHTVTEEISGIDIVRSQLLLAMGATIDSLNLPSRTGASPPPVAAIQLRITAEDAEKDFTLSMGRIVSFQPPVGIGIRTDTHLSTTKPTTVGSSFDSLLAKVIVRASSLQAATAKGLRALNDTTVKGVKTNMNVLMGILSHSDFAATRCSTRWLEAHLQDVKNLGNKLEGDKTLSLREPYITSTTSSDAVSSSAAGLGTASLLFRKGDTFKLQLKDITTKQSSTTGKAATAEEYLLRIDRVLTNNFPLHLMADATFSSYSSSKTYGMNLTSTTQTSVASSRHRHADPTNKQHIGLPFPGQFVEMYVEEGDEVAEGELLCVVRQMKMELEVRAPKAGKIKWVCEAEEGEQVNEGLLLCELVDDTLSKAAVGTAHLSKL
jgi:pyruvate carboxylase